ncbi:hypothetical protein GGU11DRAFT_827421 [Lentinula aff. detonsa]|uniref:Uncharacterized protein n=1 Tax=Lentinula aff. detonsa TaxID=2804958 RepID=A0AA38K7D6_9AGAR|nr:hypothetical protein GGU10DRAFT_381931 [Lentinula aff. detonsa]KAJ3791660.1 hypothetical protein GGU11DRAFT_827421 [Lentinula aff. detonsa]
MTEGFIPRLRRGQPYDTSFDRPDRVRRTHANPETVAILKKLPVLSRLQRNKEILDSNAQKHLHHIRDPAASISDIESIISIETSELDNIRSDSITFDLYKPFMDPSTITELKRRNDEDWKKECEDRRRVIDVANQDGNGNPALHSTTRSTALTLEPDITLIRHDPTQPTPLFFPSVLKLTAKHTKFIPLNFFTDKNLSFINAQINEIKRHKVTHEVDKPHILLIPDITSKIQASPLAGPQSESSMSYVNWLNASDNFVEFEASRFDRGHESSRVKFLSQHFAFFSQQDDAEELFLFWRPIEERLRRNHVELNTDFDGLSYAMKWTEVKSSSNAEAAFHRLLNGNPTQGPSNFSYFNHTSTDTTPFAHPAYNQNNLQRGRRGGRRGQGVHPYEHNSFRPRNGDNAPSSRCIGCGEKGHSIKDYVKHGKFWASYDGFKLRSPSGGKICVPFNLFGNCSHGCNTSEHICSLCGGSHWAREFNSNCKCLLRSCASVVRIARSALYRRSQPYMIRSDIDATHR